MIVRINIPDERDRKRLISDIKEDRHYAVAIGVGNENEWIVKGFSEFQNLNKKIKSLVRLYYSDSFEVNLPDSYVGEEVTIRVRKFGIIPFETKWILDRKINTITPILLIDSVISSP